ncbi:hypothetical protein KAH27_04920 [bacterium]|nr:hypothetical protein [bacterium]
MKRLFFITAFFLGTAFASEIQNLRVVPKNIEAGDVARIMFKLAEPAMLSVSIMDLSGNSITSIVSNALYPPGQFSIPWKTSGNIPGGYYTPLITAVNQHNGVSVTKKIETRTSKMTSVPFVILDLPGSGKKISYSLNETGLVSVRVGINNGPMYKVISNWELTQPGDYSINWDGWDSDRVIKVDQLANYLIDVRYIPVEVDALYIKNQKNERLTAVPAPELLRQIHAFIPEFSVSVSDKTTTTLNNNSIDLDIKVAEKTLEELGDIPYEYVLYIDGERYGEIENSSSPYTWKISTENISKGNHIFTLMVCTSIEQINSKSFKVSF